tara:strand:+ start:2759 stop:3286 length:528 start_codon:yes stop_codon:yes gene_type:complete
MDIDIDKFRMRVVSHVLKTFQNEKSIDTCIYTVTDEGNYKIIPAPSGPFHPKAHHEAKEKLAEIFRAMLADINAPMCCFVTEAFMYRGEKDSGKKEINTQEEYEEFKKTAEKQEILNMIFEYKNAKSDGYFMCFAIERNGKDVTLKAELSEEINNVTDSGTRSDGTFSNLLRDVK